MKYNSIKWVLKIFFLNLTLFLAPYTQAVSTQNFSTGNVFFCLHWPNVFKPSYEVEFNDVTNFDSSPTGDDSWTPSQLNWPNWSSPPDYNMLSIQTGVNCINVGALSYTRLPNGAAYKGYIYYGGDNHDGNEPSPARNDPYSNTTPLFIGFDDTDPVNGIFEVQVSPLPVPLPGQPAQVCPTASPCNKTVWADFTYGSDFYIIFEPNNTMTTKPINNKKQ